MIRMVLGRAIAEEYNRLSSVSAGSRTETG